MCFVAPNDGLQGGVEYISGPVSELLGDLVGVNPQTHQKGLPLYFIQDVCRYHEAYEIKPHMGWVLQRKGSGLVVPYVADIAHGWVLFNSIDAVNVFTQGIGVCLTQPAL